MQKPIQKSSLLAEENNVGGAGNQNRPHGDCCMGSTTMTDVCRSKSQNLWFRLCPILCGRSRGHSEVEPSLCSSHYGSATFGRFPPTIKPPIDWSSMSCCYFGSPRLSQQMPCGSSLVCGITVLSALCQFETYRSHGAMNQFAAERYAQKLSIRYVSGLCNHKRMFLNRFQLPRNHPN